MPSRLSHNSLTTTEQLQALALLEDESPTSILAYVKHARSLTHGNKRLASHELLSSEKLGAICALSDCLEDELRTLLECPHVPQDSEPCSVSHRLGPTSILIPSASFQRPLSSPNRETASSRQHATDESYSQASYKPFRPYCCTVCQRSYQNHCDWKKHEKEHEYTYICMASGHWDAVAKAFICAHCGTLNPDEEHLEAHNIERCPFQRKRREKMVKHLKDHHMVNEGSVGQSLADNWRRDEGKQFWACGFCVAVFSSFKDRLQHIGKEHYDQGQKLEEWDANKVIKGLLLQPRVGLAWESLVDAHCFHDASELTWETSDLKDLQYQLEIGPTDERSAESLAGAAYHASKVFSGQDAQERSMSPSTGSQYPIPHLITSPDRHFEDDVPLKSNPMTEQQAGIAPASLTSPFSNYSIQTPSYSGTDSQLRTPAEDHGLVGTPEFDLGDLDNDQNWAIDPKLLLQPE